MPSRSNVLNPGNSNLSEYTPGGSSVKRYVPASLLTCVRSPMTAGLVNTMDTPGMTAPDGSVMRPVITPSCACADTHTARIQINEHATTEILLIRPPLKDT